jgi:hypothetical protein
MLRARGRRSCSRGSGGGRFGASGAARTATRGSKGPVGSDQIRERERKKEGYEHQRTRASKKRLRG